MRRLAEGGLVEPDALGSNSEGIGGATGVVLMLLLMIGAAGADPGAGLLLSQAACSFSGSAPLANTSRWAPVVLLLGRRMGIVDPAAAATASRAMVPGGG